MAMSRLRPARNNAASSPEGYFDEDGMPVDKAKFYRLAYLAGRLWRPRPLDAAGFLIRANNAADILPGSDQSNGWDGLFVQGVEVVKTTGDHSTMMTAGNAAVLARQLTSLLDRCDRVSAAAAGRLNNDNDNGFISQQQMSDQAVRAIDTVA